MSPLTRRRTRRPSSRLTSVLVASVSLTVAATVLPACTFFDKTDDVLLIGDSIMNQSGDFVSAQLRKEQPLDDIKVDKSAVNGSGLLTPHVYDWDTKTDELVKEHHPKLVVMLFIGNYSDTDLFVGADGTPIPDDYGQRFFDEWGRQAESITKSLQAQNIRVSWVLPPPFLGDEGIRREEAMRTTYLELARRLPGVGLIDGRQVLGGGSGEFEWKLPDVNGKLQTVRQGDGVHLTDAGGELMARQIAFAIAPTLIDLKRQKAT
jgi:hypothetical protein